MNLNALKSKPLQHIAFLTGVPSTGTKSHITEQLYESIRRPRLPSGKSRILSVDMGIRNLAYCVIDVPASLHTTGKRLHVQSWKRLDLLEKMKPNVATSQLEDELDQFIESDKGESKAVEKAIMKNSFTPSVMSRVALQVAQDFLKYKPDVILIERQRFRSGGGSAIQEWTVRVNTLESMLWACFETMKSVQGDKKAGGFPTVYEVAPKRVASFWTGPSEAHLPAADLLTPEFSPPDLKVTAVKAKTAGAGKKEKIAVLRSWLEGTGGVSLEFSPETKLTVAAFATGLKRRKTKSSESITNEEAVTGRETKLDDLADCVLQGTAWVRWEENRRSILKALKEQKTS
jgi:cruciform cutting endonuclease 1